jgi:PAS domain-containing protein
MIDDEARLRELQRYDVLDGDPEPAFERLVEVAALVCEAPMAMISFLDPLRHRIMASYGLVGHSVDGQRSLAAQTFGSRELVIVEDASLDARFARLLLVTGEPRVRFYVGASLRTPSGYALGALCAMDRTPRRLGSAAVRALGLVRDQVMELLESRRELVELRRSEGLRQEAVEALVASTRDLERRVALRTREVEEAHARTQLLLGAIQMSERRLVEAQAVAHIGSWEWSVVTNKVVWSAEMFRIYGVDPARFDDTYEGFLARVLADDVEHTRATIADAYAHPRPFVYDHRIVRSDGQVRMLHTRGDVITNGKGVVSRMIGSCWDVTERWQANEDFERIIAVLRTGVDVMVNGLLLVVDAATPHVFTNAMLLGLAGVDASEPAASDGAALLARLAGRLVDGDRLRQAVARTRAEPQLELDEPLEHVDGRRLRCQSRPCRRGEREVVGRIWVLRLPA